MNYVLSGMKVVGQVSAGTTLKIKNHAALESIRTGLGTRDDIDILICAFNITEALAMMRIGDDWKDEIRAAQDALWAVGRRGAETGKFILRGPELTTFNLAMEIHDAQLDACTVAELEKAIDVVETIVKNKRARVIVEPKSEAPLSQEELMAWWPFERLDPKRFPKATEPSPISDIEEALF
jgi:hypothetical protein